MVRQHDDEGFGGCTNTGECQAVCPQEISIKVIGELNREYRKRDDPQAAASAAARWRRSSVLDRRTICSGPNSNPEGSAHARD